MVVESPVDARASERNGEVHPEMVSRLAFTGRRGEELRLRNRCRKVVGTEVVSAQIETAWRQRGRGE